MLIRSYLILFHWLDEEPESIVSAASYFNSRHSPKTACRTCVQLEGHARAAV